MEFEPREIVSTDWITILLVVCLVLVTASRYFFPKRFDQFAIIPFTNKYFLVQGKEDRITHPFHLLLFIAQLLSISLFILLLLDYSSDKDWLLDVPTYLQIFSFYTAFVLIKVNLEKIVGHAFGIEKLMDNYLFKKLTYRNYLALLVFAVILPFVYLTAPNNLTLLVVCVLLLGFNISSLIYIYRSFFGLILPNFFYFILYLCALEFAPYVILYKLMNNWGLM
jgi:hypothetical protein